MGFINLCPYYIDYEVDGVREQLLPSGTVARVATIPGIEVCVVDGVPIYGATTFGEIEGLPEPVDGNIYIVSFLVSGRAKRSDVVSPGTGLNDGAIRFQSGPKKGLIEAVTRFVLG